MSEAELRADLVKLQEELNWTYTALWVQEDFRRRLARGIVAWGVAAVIAGLVLVVLGLGVRTQGLAWRTWAEVVIGGVAGGVVSTLRRIQTARLGRNVDLNLVKLEQGKASIYVSPFLGAVFAGVLCLLFAAGLLKGAVFPEMDTGLPGIPRPSQGIDEAKLLVWSFVAGFAEKLVPNRLDQLARQAETDEPRSQASAASTEAKE